MGCLDHHSREGFENCMKTNVYGTLYAAEKSVDVLKKGRRLLSTDIIKFNIGIANAYVRFII